jgi:hypothetical protein
MKDKLISIFVAFVRKTFTKERLLDFIDDLLDIFYDRFAAPYGCVDGRFVDQEDAFADLKEACDKDV